MLVILSCTYCCDFFHQRTPLHMAAREGYDSTVEVLADEGAKINMGDCNGVCEATLLTLH